MKWIMYANPLTYGLAAIREVLYWGHGPLASTQPGLVLSLVISLLFAVVMFVLAAGVARGRVAADLQ